MKFSVVIPAYNAAATLKRAMNSVLAQSAKNSFELIIVDDGSTDDSAIIVETYAEKHNNIILQCQNNSGAATARNRGISMAKNELVCLLDADDEWQQDFLIVISQLVEKYPHAALYASAYDLLKYNSQYAPLHFRSVPTDNGIIDSYFRTVLRGSLPFYTSCVCLRRTIFLKEGGFPENEKYGEDMYLWSRLAAKYPIAWSSYRGATIYTNVANRVSDNYQREVEWPFFAFLDSIPRNKIRKSELPYLNKYIARMRLAIAGKQIKNSFFQDGMGNLAKINGRYYLMRRVLYRIIATMRINYKHYGWFDNYVRKLKKRIGRKRRA
jgi:glycosyltransferase involved in cell wall biosynthesis